MYTLSGYDKIDMILICLSISHTLIWIHHSYILNTRYIQLINIDQLIIQIYSAKINNTLSNLQTKYRHSSYSNAGFCPNPIPQIFDIFINCTKIFVSFIHSTHTLIIIPITADQLLRIISTSLNYIIKSAIKHSIKRWTHSKWFTSICAHIPNKIRHTNVLKLLKWSYFLFKPWCIASLLTITNSHTRNYFLQNYIPQLNRTQTILI